MLSEQADILGPVAQRRHVDRHDVQTIEQVFAELTLGNQVFEILVGGGQYPYIQANAGLSADPADDAALQCPQQPCLRMFWHVADFIEEQSAALSLFESANRLADRTSKGTLFMTEKFSLDQFGRDRSHIDRHKWPGFAVTKAVNRFGDQFLTGTRLAGDQHRKVVAQQPGDHPVNVLHRCTAPDHRQIRFGEILSDRRRHRTLPVDALLHR